MTSRVFVVDDHEVVRQGVIGMISLEDDLVVVGEAASVAEALDKLPPTRPDVAVIDVRLPDGNGVELARELRSAHPELSCLMLTSYADDEALLDAVVAGAAGYVLKQIRGTELVSSIRRVAAGHVMIDPALVGQARRRLRAQAAELTGLSTLSAQERRILGLLSEGLTNRQIGERTNLAEKTVKNYVSNLLVKLGMERRTQAAVYATRMTDRLRGDQGRT